MSSKEKANQVQAVFDSDLQFRKFITDGVPGTSALDAHGVPPEKVAAIMDDLWHKQGLLPGDRREDAIEILKHYRRVNKLLKDRKVKAWIDLMPPTK